MDIELVEASKKYKNKRWRIDKNLLIMPKKK